MIKYGSDHIEELKFSGFQTFIERRDGQWIDIVLTPRLAPDSKEIPTDLIDFSILVICKHDGNIAQMVPQDIGCDCEYQLTFSEKEQVRAWIVTEALQQQIREKAEQEQ